MTADGEYGAYMAALGETVLGRGYPVIPIKPGEKRPANGDGWQRTVATVEMVRGWIGNGAGIGILTRHTPGVDLDILDHGCAQHMDEWIRDTFGYAPVRYGLRPKRLLLFRCDDPFPKVQSRKWRSPKGKEGKVEILCDGQQFVAFHIHPDTGKPYEWRENRGPHTMDRTELRRITRSGAERIVEEFERHVEELGWKPVLPPGSGGAFVTVAGRGGAQVLPFPKEPMRNN